MRGRRGLHGKKRRRRGAERKYISIPKESWAYVQFLFIWIEMRYVIVSIQCYSRYPVFRANGKTQALATSTEHLEAVQRKLAGWNDIAFGTYKCWIYWKIEANNLWRMMHNQHIYNTHTWNFFIFMHGFHCQRRKEAWASSSLDWGCEQKICTQKNGKKHTTRTPIKILVMKSKFRCYLFLVHVQIFRMKNCCFWLNFRWYKFIWAALDTFCFVFRVSRWCMMRRSFYECLPCHTNAVYLV